MRAGRARHDRAGPPPVEAVHATVVAIDGRGLLIRGPSRAGKSSLALALIAASRAILVGDDRVLLSASGPDLIAAPHPRIAGLIERRGQEIVAMPFRPSVALAAVVEIAAAISSGSDEATARSTRCVLAGRNFPALLLVNRGRLDTRWADVLAWFTATSTAHQPLKPRPRTSSRSKD